VTGHRQNRLAGEIQREISQIIRDQMKDPRVGFVTVTDVEVSGDIRHAKIFVSVLGDETVTESCLAGLSKAKGFIRSELARRINVRYMPELHFKVDQSLDYSQKINSILTKVKEDL